MPDNEAESPPKNSDVSNESDKSRDSAEIPSDKHAVEADEYPYTIMTSREKYYFSVLIACSGIWSTTSSSIYFPALPILSEKFKESASITNVSVVAYLLFQGISPTIVAPFADAFGRRPMAILSLLCYTGVNVALSQVNVYWLLVVLRCLQASAIAPIVSISSGSIGDVCTRADRGTYMGIAVGLQLVGQGFGALVGSGFVSRWGWRGIFEGLAIGSGFVLILVIFLYPETNRSLVGNLSIKPKHILNKSPLIYLPFVSRRLTNDLPTKTESNVRLDNVITPFKIFFKRDVFFVLLPAGLQFAAWTMSLTTLSTTLADRYDFPVIHIGLCYIAPGMGALIGAIVSGRLLNYVYKLQKTKYDEETKSLPAEDVKPFNIYKARLHICTVPSLVAAAFYIIFGWCLQKKVNIAPVLISAFVYSVSAMCIMSALTTLLVDIYPNQSSASTSCVNLMRCLLGAAGVGVLQSMVDAMGEGGTYTLMAGFLLIGTGVMYWVVAEATKKLENSTPLKEGTPS